jgi:hypothetical protein
MSKRWKQAALIAWTGAFALNAYALDVTPPKESPESVKKEVKKKKGKTTFTICALPFSCGPKGGKRPEFTGKKAPKPIKLGNDPLSKAILAEPGVTTAIRVNGKIVYVKGDDSLALPASTLPAEKISPTSEANGEDFKTVRMKTDAAAQANEMSERTSKVGAGAGASKEGAAKAFGLGEKSKS